MRTIVVFSRDHELAELAAVGIRFSVGWNVVIASEPLAAREAIELHSVYAILTIALRSTYEVVREIRDLYNLGNPADVPVVVVTPEPFLCQELRSLGVLPICAAFDPLMLAYLIDDCINSRPTATPYGADH